MNTTKNTTAVWNRAAGRVLARGLALVALAGAASLFAAGCSDDNGTQPPASFEAKGAALMSGGSDIVVDSNGVTGSISVGEGLLSDEISASFIAKSDGKRSVPGTGFTLSWTIADTSIASIETVSTWSFKVRGRKAGNTTATLKLMNGASTVYTSGAIAITVTPSIMGLHTGDTATFTFYDRDTNNQKVTASEKTKVWTVMSEAIRSDNRSRNLSILEVTYDGTSTVELGRDTIHLRMDDDGSVYEYDLLRKLLVRVSGGEAFNSKLDPYWVRISNTNSINAATWQSLVRESGITMTGVDSIKVDNVTANGIPAAMNVIFKMNAYHQGAQALTVPAGSYPTAVRTDHTLRLNVKLATLPITVLDDSLHATFNLSAKDGILRQTFEGKILTAKAATITQTLPVTGFEMELKAIKRKQ